MDNQVFHNPNSNSQAPRYRNPQFRSFNPKPAPASKVEKSLSLGTKPTHTAGESEECEEPPARTAASPAMDTRLRDSVHVETPEFPAPEAHHAEDDCSSNNSPVGNASDNGSDSEEDLRSLFSELGDDSSDTESNPDCKVEGIHKPSSDGMVGEGRLATGDSKDTPIVLDDESFANTTHEREQEERRDDDEINSGTTAGSPSRKRKRESELALPDVEETGFLSVSSGREHDDETQPPCPAGTGYRSGRYFDESRSDIVWEYRHLDAYNIVNGEPFVQVIWCPTWEPAGEFSTAEVERIKRKYDLRRSKQRGRPPLRRAVRTEEA